MRVLLDRDLPDQGQTVMVIKSGAGAPELLSGERFDVEVQAPAGGLGPVDALHRSDGGGSLDALVFGAPAGAVERRLLELEYGGREPSTRPVEQDEVRAILLADEEAEPDVDLRRVARGGGSIPFLCQSPAMRRSVAAAERVAPSSAPVLLRGETGTGKSLLARIVHDASPRASRPFVTINCSAFPETLLESELFGHERGAFTGAVGAKPGLFELADGGTLLLDEVGETSAAMQAKLLHVLDGDEIRRVGGTALAAGRRAGDRRDPSRSRARGRRRPLPGGSLLPPAGVRDPGAAVARAPRGPAGDDPLLSRTLSGPGRAGEEHLRRGARPARGAPLARQRARARERGPGPGTARPRARRAGRGPAADAARRHARRAPLPQRRPRRPEASRWRTPNGLRSRAPWLTPAAERRRRLAFWESTSRR